MPTCAGHGLGGGPRVAGQQPHVERRPRAAPGPPRPTRPDRVGDRDQAGGGAVDGHVHDASRRRPRRSAPARRAPRGRRRARSSAAGCRPATSPPVDRARRRRVRRSPRTRRPRWKPSSRLARPPDDRLAERVLGARSSDAARSSSSGGVDARRRARRPRPRAGRASACRSCRTRRCRRGPAVSSASPPRTRIPASAPLPGPDHDRGRRGEAHRARAGDDHDPDERREGEREAAAPGRPASRRRTSATRPRGRAGTNTSLTRSARRWIGALEPWARSTSSTIRARAVSRPTRVARITNEPVVLMRRADDLVAGRLGDRDRLAGEHRLVDGARRPRRRRRRPGPCRRAGPAAGRPGTTDRQLDVLLDAVADAAGRRRLERDEPPDRAGRPALRAALEPPPEQDQADDDRRAVEVGHGLDAGRRARPRATASRPSSSPRRRSSRRRPACPSSCCRGARPATPRGRSGRPPRTG